MNSRVCVDASLAVQWLIPTQQDPLAESLLQSWDQAGTELIGPPLFDAEVTSTIRRHVYFKKLLPAQGEKAFLFYHELAVKIVSPPELPRIAWQLAQAFNLPVCYDMHYLAVAELEDCELWTADSRLANSLKGKNKRLRWLGDYAKKT
ncbi:MAG: type II toxin-antitoxin system VapC family toxin [Chloroflexi bacterium]|nr:type II toxin-antitoxin system VapC family toxin [Chloroflexota bacterium]